MYDNLHKLDFGFLKESMKLVIYGSDPQLIYDKAVERIVLENKSGMALLKQLISLTAALSIQKGDEPDITLSLCTAYLGIIGYRIKTDLMNNREKIYRRKYVWRF